MSKSESIVGVILAAGKGTRMKSKYPKCAHKVCGVPMTEHIGRAMREAGVPRPIVVVGHEAELMKQALGNKYDYVEQKEQLGTGHAVLISKPFWEESNGLVLISPGDTPLISSEVLIELVDHHKKVKADISVVTTLLENPAGYGRLVRDQNGNPIKIVEEKDTDAQSKKIKEVSAGIYCINVDLLKTYLPKMSNDNAQQEYYLPEVLKMLAEDGKRVSALVHEDSNVLIGVNDRWQLAEAAAILREIILKKHALAGVTIIDPSSTHIGVDVQIDTDVIIEPMTIIEGKTRIGVDSVIGPGVKITDSIIEAGVNILYSNVVNSHIKKGANCGPYANLRPETVIGENARIGNFVEIKKSTVGTKASVAHLAYIGDASIGDNSNIGAGTIFCNYDGFKKHITTIGANAFIGSNSTLISPINIADGAMVAAGSVVTFDVPEEALAISRGKQQNKELWAQKWRKIKKSES